MKNIYKYSFAVLSLLFVTFFSANAQVNTIYYMKTIPVRHELNPAYQPLSNIYIDLPVLPSVQIGFGNNSLTFGDVVYPKKIDGKIQTITFLHPEGNVADFYNSLKKNTKVHSEFQMDLLSFGFRVKKHYFTLGIQTKADISAHIPKDLFKLVLYGTPDSTGVNKYNLGNYAMKATAYSEVGLGYSYEVNEHLTVGGKLKYLMGHANASTKINKLNLNASRDSWDADIDGTINASIPYSTYRLDEENRLDNVKVEFPDKVADYFNLFSKPQGNGVAIDAGATYKILDNHLTFSLSVLDVGFIRWKRNVVNIPVKGSFTFEGLDIKVEDGEVDWDEDYFQDMLDSIHYETTFNKYNTWLSAKVMAGVEYAILDQKITFGLLSKSTIDNGSIFEEITTSVNFLPINWFNTTFSYSWINGRFSNLGLGIGGRLGPWSMYIAGDYIPLRYTSEAVPYKTQYVNIKMGLMLTFGNPKNPKKDSDHDGVINRKDKCPDTSLGYLVDKRGCPIDEDGDGVADNVDKCPGTPKGVAVDSVGCPIDSDNDGIADYLDKCPDTPVGVAVDSVGCPIDSDNDGVADYLDKCPNTPAGIAIDSIGCPIDSDKDGVPDYLDKCPDTPIGMEVDSDGCPDSDGDGVADHLDKCPRTPAAARGFVDEYGCPKDTDLDGVPDFLDECPTVKGTKENKGCPEIKASEKQVFQKALQGIQFESGKDVIKPVSFDILNQIVKIMKENSHYYLTINGHTDNVGSPASNQVLSENRANAVKNYLIKGGVEPVRLTAQGFGDAQPVVENTTAANKAKNRRVEFVVKFEE